MVTYPNQMHTHTHLHAPVTKFSAQNFWQELVTRKNAPVLFWEKPVWLMTLSVLETQRHDHQYYLKIIYRIYLTENLPLPLQNIFDF